MVDSSYTRPAPPMRLTKCRVRFGVGSMPIPSVGSKIEIVVVLDRIFRGDTLEIDDAVATAYRIEQPSAGPDRGIGLYVGVLWQPLRARSRARFTALDPRGCFDTVQTAQHIYLRATCLRSVPDPLGAWLYGLTPDDSPPTKFERGVLEILGPAETL